MATRFSVERPVITASQILQDPPVVRQVAVTPTKNGFHVFVVDANARLSGYTYEFSDESTLLETAHNVPIMADVAGTIAAVALGGTDDPAEALLAVPCSGSSTTLIPLDAQLRPMTSTGTTPGVVHDGWLAGAGSLVAVDASHLVWLALKDGTSEFYGKPVSRLGADESNGSPQLIDTGGRIPSMFVRAGTGYIVVWNVTSLSAGPDEIHAMMLDDQLRVVAGDTKISPDASVTTENSNLPAVAYSASAKVALFAWAIKKDQIWFSFRDERLQPTTHKVPDIQPGNAPQIVTTGDDFLVVWTSPAGQTSKLTGARVGVDGSFTQPGLSRNNGTAPGWDVVVRGDQSALVWFEDVTTSANLWFDALCKPQ